MEPKEKKRFVLHSSRTEVLVPVGLQQTQCLRCRNTMHNSRIEATFLVCGHCEARYPLVGGVIPIYLPDPVADLAATCLRYQHHIQSERNAIQRLRRLAVQKPARATVVEQLAAARESNLDYIVAMQNVLLEYVSVQDVLAAESTPADASYEVAHTYYLERDWSGTLGFEAEIHQRVQMIQHVLRTYAVSTDSLLVLGAGTGRVSWELGNEVDQVYALDRTFCMPYSYHTLHQQDIAYYTVQPSNIWHSQDRVRKQTASPKHTPHVADTCQEYTRKMTYLMASATDIPLPDQSQAAVVSVYFTDVLPLHTYLSEVCRVLKPGGLFIHLGPLTYHFSDESDMYTADELRSVLAANGLEVVEESKWADATAFAETAMSTTCFTNWMCTARKKAHVPRRVTPEAKLKCTAGLMYEQYGTLGRPETASPQVFLVVPSGKKMKTSVVIRDLLGYVSPERTLEDVLADFSETYLELSDVHRAKLLQTMQELVDGQVLEWAD